MWTLRGQKVRGEYNLTTTCISVMYIALNMPLRNISIKMGVVTALVLPSLFYYYTWSNLTQEIVILGIYYESNLAQVHH